LAWWWRKWWALEVGLAFLDDGHVDTPRHMPDARRDAAGAGVRQAIPPARLLGRVITGVRVVGLGAVLPGALAGGLVARSAALRAPFFMAPPRVAAAAYAVAAALTRNRIDDAIAPNADLLSD
jgi:hypothetical protein